MIRNHHAVDLLGRIGVSEVDDSYRQVSGGSDAPDGANLAIATRIELVNSVHSLLREVGMPCFAGVFPVATLFQMRGDTIGFAERRRP
jgi:hypothetical protein